MTHSFVELLVLIDADRSGLLTLSVTKVVKIAARGGVTEIHYHLLERYRQLTVSELIPSSDLTSELPTSAVQW